MNKSEKGDMMSYQVTYQHNDAKGVVIHVFTTKREAEAFAKSHKQGCERLFGGIMETQVIKSKEPPDMGWLHGRLVRLYPMEF